MQQDSKAYQNNFPKDILHNTATVNLNLHFTISNYIHIYTAIYISPKTCIPNVYILSFQSHCLPYMPWLGLQVFTCHFLLFYLITHMYFKLPFSCCFFILLFPLLPLQVWLGHALPKILSLFVILINLNIFHSSHTCKYFQVEIHSPIKHTYLLKFISINPNELK